MEKNMKGTTAPETEKAALGALSIYIQRGVRWLVGRMAAHPAVAKLLSDMDDDAAQLIYDFLPGLAGLGISRVKDEWFATPERADMVREMINEFVKKSLDELHKANDPNYDLRDPEKVAAEAKKQVEETKLVMDKTGHFHLDDCLELKRNFKKNETHAVAWKDVVEQGKLAADCCFKRASQAFEKQQEATASPKRPNKKVLSAADVIGMADAETRKKLNDWLGGLNATDAAKVREYLVELDDEFELTGLLAIDEKHRLEWMGLLKEKSARRLVSTVGELVSGGGKTGLRVAKTLVAGVAAGANNVLTAAGQLDSSFAAEAARLEAEAKKPVDTRGPLARLLGLKK